ncbi:Recombination inhibitory protein MutS2 [hydrothermal vent metagenome]|uniref:Recombination inhibitory protein MutS2 n=1 Tax=hydrothermal vent metagenome TaxID=652676 RepID=A0A3B1C1D4_9ZZZZ
MPDISRAYEALGLDKVVSELTARANTATGKIAIGDIKPLATLEEAERALDITAAMIELMSARPDFDIEPCENPLGLLVKARKYQALTGAEIRAFTPLLRNSEKLHNLFSIEEVGEDHPLSVPLPSVHGLADLIDEAIDEEGSVRSDATPEIERLYKAARSLKHAIGEKAQNLLKDKGISPMLQDEYVTLREDRFVLPIRAEHKSHIDGIVHDSSNSGQTFFIEPKALVEMNNRLKTAEMELDHEIKRLLHDITMMIVEETEVIELIHDSITRLDVIASKARLAMDLSCSRPVFGERVDLKNVANPLMLLEGKKVVRNNISIRQGAKALVISGPNAGGKTVSLKTVGLLSIMARMGLFITAEEGSRFPFYKHIYADIGDSQSITDDLSTFSAHIKAINEITRNAGYGSLVLVDELMVSTDPKEGSALAVATLDYLVLAGADVIVTTHYGDLKILAQSQPYYHNVSMEFDDLAARPTYRIVDGAPGSSSALAVAERLGLEKSIIVSAQSRLTGGDERIETALNELRDQKIRLERDRMEAGKTIAEVKRLEEETRLAHDRIAEREKELGKTVKRKLATDLANARRAISEMVEKAQASSKDKAALKVIREEVEKMANETRWAAAPKGNIAKDELKAGDEVYVVSLERSGRLESNPADGRVEVAFGSMRVTANVDDVVGIKKGSDRSRNVSVAYASAPKGVKRDQNENRDLDIRGVRVEEGVERLVKFLDDAIKNDVAQIRIIHGKGTGALRSAVREYLQESPYVESFATEELNMGGDGVTVVVLRG